MPLILGTNSIKDTGFDVANSLRFNDGSSDSLQRSMATATSRRKFTISMWIKKCSNSTGGEQVLFHTWVDSNNRVQIGFQSNNKLQIRNRTSGSDNEFNSDMVFRDTNAWYHIVVQIDSTNGTQANRVRVYVNGNQITGSGSLDSVLNLDYSITSSHTNYIGQYGGVGNFFDGYMTEVVYLDGQSLDATSFGEFDEDSGIWKPIDVSGLTFGTNGFYLDFENSGSLGADVSGNGNNFTVNNLTSIDQTTDTPTNNGCTLNPLLVPISYPVTFADGNLKTASQSSTGRFQAISSIGASSGKWYAEFKLDSGTTFHTIGVATEDSISSASVLVQNSNNYLGQGSSLSYIYYGHDGDVWSNGSISSGFGSTTSVGDIIGVAMDLDNNYLYFSVNGTFQNSGDPTSGATGTGGVSIPSDKIYFFAVGDLATGSFNGTTCNFGSPAFTISSGNSDGNSKGNFEYAVPSGYFALCTSNLAEHG